MTFKSLFTGMKINLFSLVQSFLNRRKIPTRWKTPGKCLEYHLTGDCLELAIRCEKAEIKVVQYTGGIFRVQVVQKDSPVYNSVSVIEPVRCRLRAIAGEGRVLQITGENNQQMKLLFNLDDCSFTFMHGSDVLSRVCAAASANGWVRAEFHSPVQEKYAGFGQKTGSLFKNGKTLIMWNMDDSNVTGESDPLYQSCPLQIALRADGTAHGFFFDNPHYCVFKPGDDSTTPVSLYAAERGQLCFYVLPGRALKAVTGQYTELTGRYRLPPRWVLGHHHSRWEELESAERIIKLAGEFRSHQVPCDVIHIDIGHLDGYRCFTWHPQRFPDPAALVAELHTKGFKVVVIVDPGLKKDKHWPIYREGVKQDVFCRDYTGRIYHGPVWPGNCAFVDYMSGKAARWWGNLYRGYIETGIDGFWNDMNEPSVFSPLRTMPDRVVFRGDDGECYSHKTIHNIYGLLMARASAAGITGLRPNMRYFLFCRSSFAGIQRYASTWTGDNSSNWEHLRMSIPMLLNMGLSGQVMCGPDTGGFWKEPTAELMIRWVQLSTFYPFNRNHTSLATPPQEFWNMGEKVKAIAQQYLDLRYRLLPYLYTCLQQSCTTGLPVMRPLFLDFPGDPAALDAGIANSEFMAGDNLLVAPVLEPGQVKRDVYLPAGTDWVDWWTGNKLAGGNSFQAAAPPDRMPVFVKSGAVIPMGCRGAMVTEEIDKQPLYLVIYPGKTINGTVYLDDGISLDYQDSEYSLLKISGQATDRSLIAAMERSAGNLKFPAYAGHPALIIKVHLAGFAGKSPQVVTAGGNALHPGAFSITDDWLEIRAGAPVLPWELRIEF